VKNEEVIRIFMENASKVAAEPFWVTNLSEMNQILGKILENDTAIYCPNMTELEKSVHLDPTRRVDTFMRATATVEEVVAGVAETGSIVVTSANDRAVQASLLPTRHVAILSASNIFETLDDFFNGIGYTIPSNITFITGPSRTADIELTLTIGVHGPEKIFIILV
jgi:L-lactate utilization protein LutC